MRHKPSAVKGVAGFIMVLGVIIRTGLCYESGAPYSTCLTMFPRHQTAERQIISSRFAIALMPATYRPRETISVSLYSLDGRSFRGFLVKATLATGDTERAMGTFVRLQENKTRVFTCEGGYKNTVTHSNNAPVKHVTLSWRAPEENVGDIVFRATVVEEFSTFWTGVLGNLKAATKDSVLLAQSPPGVEARSDGIDLTSCGVARGCFLYPRHCFDADCIASASFWLDGDRYMFELSATDSTYVAIGFSEDQNMGDDETVACTAGDILSVQHGYNTKHDNQRLPQVHHLNSQVFEKAVARIDRRISCSFSRSIATVIGIINQSAPTLQVDDITFNLTRGYHVMLAWGHVMKGTDVISKHITIPPVTDVKVVFGQHAIYRGFSLSLAVRVHVGLMSLAWILGAGLAAVRPRYLKSWFSGSKVSEERLWAQVHHAVAIMSCVLTILGILVILPNHRGVFSAQRLHAILGLTVTCLVFVGSFAGLWVPKLQSERNQALYTECETIKGRQQLCKECHGVLGLITCVIAVASIYSGYYISFIQKAMREYGEVVVVVWITSEALWIVAFELRERLSVVPPSTIKDCPQRKKIIRKVDAAVLAVYLIYLFVIWGLILNSVIIF